MKQTQISNLNIPNQAIFLLKDVKYFLLPVPIKVEPEIYAQFWN